MRATCARLYNESFDFPCHIKSLRKLWDFGLQRLNYSSASNFEYTIRKRRLSSIKYLVIRILAVVVVALETFETVAGFW